MEQRELQFKEKEVLEIWSVIVMGIDYCPITDSLPVGVKSPALVYAGWSIRNGLSSPEVCRAT